MTTPITFADLNLRPEIMQAVAREGYTNPTPIQAQSIPAVMNGQDVLGLAQTGTGKTAAFVLPMLHHLMVSEGSRRVPRALILAPTRELAIQISDSIQRYGAGLKLYHTQIVGGASQVRQVEQLRRGVDIVIATPGRLEDLMQQRLIDISKIEMFVLDEADRMLEIGFMPSIRRITAALPQKKQTLFFSATMPREVADLARGLLHNPLRIEVTPVSTPIERIKQMVIPATISEKRQILVDLMADPALARVVVFTRTKHGADKVARVLESAGVSTSVMHGRKSQGQRQAALGAFGRGQVRAMVATDIAARGIDVDDVTHVINYDVPHEPETYVHRIGRTARAGKSGVAISMCEPNGEERGWLRQIERLTRQTIEVVARPASSGIVAVTPAHQPQYDDRRGGGGRSQGSGRSQGGYQGRSQGGRSEGGYQGRSQGDRPQGDRQGYQGRSQGGYQGRPQNDRPQGDRQGYQARPQIQRDEFVGQPGDQRREPGAYQQQPQRREGFIKPYGSENAGNDNGTARPAGKKPFWKKKADAPQNRGSFGRKTGS